jgi:hypothetical protein
MASPPPLKFIISRFIYDILKKYTQVKNLCIIALILVVDLSLIKMLKKLRHFGLEVECFCVVYILAELPGHCTRHF